MSKEHDKNGFDDYIRKNWNAFLDGITQNLPMEKIDPNIITATGGGLGVLTGYLLSRGNINAARASFVGAGLADALDGWVARKFDKSSGFGAYLDSVLDRVSDTSIMYGMEKYARQMGWSMAANMAQIARPLVVGPSLARMEAEKSGVEIRNQSYGSRLARMGAISACLFLPDERVWNVSMSYILAASGATTFERVRAVSKNPESTARLWETFDRWGEAQMSLPQLIADISLCADYAIGKAGLITDDDYSSLQIPHEVIDTLCLFGGEKIASGASLAQSLLNTASAIRMTLNK